MANLLGQGDWTAQVTNRGGSPLVFQVPWGGLGLSYTLNNTGTGRLNFPADADSRSACCEVAAVTEPYEHELILWRDEVLAYAGPVVSVGTDAGDISSRDLSHWMDVRFMDDMHADGDSAQVFKMVFDNAYAKDTSPNINLAVRDSGIQTTLDVKEIEFRRASDALRSLSSYGIDWTVVGRTILAGGQEVFENGGERLLLHDEAVASGTMTKEGGNLATDLAVFGGRENQSSFPVTGRAVTGTSKYGLVQKSVTDLLIFDKVAADASALARLEAMQPTPRRVSVTLSDKAAFGFVDLVCGRQFDVRLYDSLGCGQVDQVMRLQQVDVTVGDNEEVSLSLVPLGVSEGT